MIIIMNLQEEGAGGVWLFNHIEEKKWMIFPYFSHNIDNVHGK